MITRNSTLACLFLSSSIFAAETTFKNTEEKVSYLIGRNIGNSLLQDGVKVEIEPLIVGFREALLKKESQISEKEADDLFSENYARLEKEKIAERKALAQKALEEGEAFLAKNGKREGVVTTKSGLQYEVISTAEGAKPLEADHVLVHLHGTLTNGLLFDSTVDRGVPGNYRVNQLLPGLQEAIKLMPQGSKWKVYVPTKLGFGEYGSGDLIGPNNVLIYEVELLTIQDFTKDKTESTKDGSE